MSPAPDDRAAAASWRQLRLGAGILVLLAVAAAAVFFVDSLESELSEGPRLYVEAASAGGIEVGSDVWIAGIRAGRVEAVRLERPGSGGGPILVQAVLDRDAARLLRADASASLRASALLAPAVVALNPGTEIDRPFRFRDTLVARPALRVDELLARADTLRSRLHDLAPEGRALASRLANGPGTLASLRAHPATLDSLRADLARSRRLALASPGGTAMRLLRDTALRREAHRVRARLAALAAPGGPLARTRRERAVLWGALDSLRHRKRLLDARLAEGRGTAGRVLHDRAIQRERALFRARMDSVKTELFAHPLRWLRFALF